MSKKMFNQAELLPQYMSSGSPIRFVEQYVDLNVTIDGKLKFHSHIGSAVNKVSVMSHND